MLLSFGLSEEDSSEIANAFVDVSDSLIAAYDGLDLGIDSTTLSRLTMESKGSRLMLRTLLEGTGLSDEDIQSVLGVFDTNISSLVSGTPDIFSNIYDALTDGLPDTEGQTDAFTEQIYSYFGGTLEQIDADLQAQIAELDTTAPDYDQKVADLTAAANAAKEEVKALQDEALEYVTTMSGKSTETVQASLDDLVSLEQRVSLLQQSINKANTALNEEGKAAFTVVRSGANADQETIGLAINFKATEFKIDEQSAQDAYDAAIRELNRQLDSGEITTEEYNTKVESETATRDAAISEAREAYEQALREIFKGIAESEGNEAALKKILQVQDSGSLINAFLDSLTFNADGALVSDKTDALNTTLGELLGESYDPQKVIDMMKSGDVAGLTGYLQSDLETQIYGISTENASELLGGKLGEAYSAALEGGFFTGTSFDTSSQEEQLAAILGAIGDSGVEGFSNALENGAGVSESGASTMAQGALDGAQNTLQTGSPSRKFFQIGEWAGQGLVNGLNSKYSAVYAAARRLAQAAESGARITLRISSPSKVFEELGVYTGEGFLLGYEKSIRDAQRTVRNLTGSLISAAHFSSFPMRSTAQAAEAGNAYGAGGDTDTPFNVGLYINDRKIAEATSDANARISNARAKRVAAGWGVRQ